MVRLGESSVSLYVKYLCIQYVSKTDPDVCVCVFLLSLLRMEMSSARLDPALRFPAPTLSVAPETVAHGNTHIKPPVS